MKQIFSLLLLLVISQVALAQAPSNYTNINGRYRWIAGMFDSTFHIPKGSTPSLRTGGSTNAGGLFYNTSDSSVYTYTGTQWIKVRGSINPSDTTNKYVTQVYKKSGSDSVFYVKGGTHIWAFNDSTGVPGGGGGGKVYYFNGGVSMGTFGGFTMYELGDTANTGTAANFTRSTTGNIANFITDPNKPGLLQIPAGVWNIDAWLSESGGGANHAQIYAAVEKWDGSTITTIATSPIEEITNGNVVDLYTWTVSIPTTALAVTDRIIIQFYIQNTNGKTVTLYTQNGYVGEVHTTFTTGIGALNGLTAPAQYLVTGTSGTDFNISSATATHTFNLPTASATNRGALSTTDWSTFNAKIGGSGTANYVSKFTGASSIGNSALYSNASGNVSIGNTNDVYKLDVSGTIKSNSSVTVNTGVIAGQMYAQDGYFGLQASTNHPMTFTLQSTERMRILTTGEIGIGLETPDSNLTVNLGTHLKRGVRMSGLPTGVGTKALRINANGTLSIADTLANGISGTGTTNYIPKFTSSSAIGNSAVYDASGSIGIGTITPLGQFHTYTSAYKQLLLTYPSTFASRLTIGSSEFYIENDASPETTSYVNATGTGTFIWKGGSSATERMRLTSTGLGIGTSSPSQKLSVDGSSNTQIGILSSAIGTPTNNTGIIFGYTGNTYQKGALYFVSRDGNGRGNLQFALEPTANSANVSTSDTKMTLTYEGNLGVGTSSPSEKLQVNGIARFVRSAATSQYLNLSIENGNVDYDAYGTINHVFKNAGTEQMRLNTSGNLGLGVTPSSWGSGWKAFQVTGSSAIWSDGGQRTFFSNNAYYNGTNRIYVANGYAQEQVMDSDGAYYWKTAASGTAGGTISYNTRMTLDNSGNLGLGVTPENSSGTWRNFQFGGGNIVFRNGLVTGAFIGTGYIFKTNNSEVYSTNSAVSRIYFDDNVIRFQQAPSGTAGNAISFTQAMTLDASGRLGIGTSSPTGLFTSYKSQNGDPVLGLFYNNNAGTSTESVVYVTNSSSTADGLFLETTGSSFTTAGGFVQDASIIGSGTGASGGLSIMTRANADMRFYTNGHTNERMRISSSGDVGIGNTGDASVRLFVTGKDATSNNYAALFRNSSGSNLLGVKNSGTINMGSLPTSSTGLSAGDIWNDNGTLKIVQ